MINTHRVRHSNSCVWHKLDFAFAGQIDIYNSVAIEANLQFLVSPQVMILSIFICLTDNSYRREEMHVSKEMFASRKGVKWVTDAV